MTNTNLTQTQIDALGILGPSMKYRSATTLGIAPATLAQMAGLRHPHLAQTLPVGRRILRQDRAGQQAQRDECADQMPAPAQWLRRGLP